MALIIFWWMLQSTKAHNQAILFYHQHNSDGESEEVEDR